MGHVVLFGATGYTGRLTAEAMVRAGLDPVLAGRSPDRLADLAEALAPLAPTGAAPRTRVATVDDPASVRALLESPDDVLVSTVGPFTRYGTPAVQAAVEAGAAYVDSTGEPPFVRSVFEEWGPRARQTGARLLTAFGYDYVPGNLAGALALRDARESGRPARAIDVGYFVAGGMGASAGTRASSVEIALAPSMEYRGGTLREARIGGRVKAFDIGDGRRWDALSVGGSEHLALPRLEPGLDEVGVYLGWAGRWTKAVSLASSATALASLVPGVRGGLAAMTRRLVGESDGSGPDGPGGRTVAVAVARDGVGREVARSRVEGPAPYPLTGDLLAWAAAMLATGAQTGAGALGPADAFGLDALVTGCADMGLTRVV
jgi:short subunit dehydrogenase-like uncharacterized protein